MFARATKIRLALFLLIAVVGIGYTGGMYVGLDQVFGGSGYDVKVEMASSGGVFTNSEVTYRGVAVGRVVGLRLTNSGIEADVHIEPSAPQIPADAEAVVANRSAVGEQYIDLRPRHNGGPYLAAGSLIARSSTSLPPAPETLLVNLDSLVNSVPKDSLRTVVSELGNGFQGSGPDLQRMLDSTSSFTAAADQHLPQTANLLANSDTVLRTQQDEADQLISFSHSLNGISQQLKRSDPDLRKLITAAPQVGQQVGTLVRSTGNDLGVVVANLLTTTQLTEVRQPGMEELLVALPVISAFTHTLSPDGTGHLGVVLNSFDPMACTKGYEGTPRRPGSDTSPGPTNYGVQCDEPQGSPTDVRGSQNVPRAPIPPAVAPPPPLPLAR